MILCWGTDSVQNSIPARSSCVTLLCVMGVRTASERHASPLHFAAVSHLLSEGLQVLRYWTDQGVLRTEGKHHSQLQNPCVHVSEDSSISAFHLLSKSWTDKPEMKEKPYGSRNLLSNPRHFSKTSSDSLSATVTVYSKLFLSLLCPFDPLVLSVRLDNIVWIQVPSGSRKHSRSWRR